MRMHAPYPGLTVTSEWLSLSLSLSLSLWAFTLPRHVHGMGFLIGLMALKERSDLGYLILKCLLDSACWLSPAVKAPPLKQASQLAKRTIPPPDVWPLNSKPSPLDPDQQCCPAYQTSTNTVRSLVLNPLVQASQQPISIQW